ncbi:MAG: TonB-dependent receptor [Gammaproteobacteria bacterium]|nr:TonB-dependent receptor [Gammaproteobacteria bacterium]|tara:strand:+ start:2346 stop:4121 length:1776 start_codon:yes stop_codon:yes gene_type:complete
MKQKSSLAFLLLMLSHSISAQDSSSIDELIVTATKSELSADQVVAPVVVIDQLDIELSGVNGIAELLSSVAGINISTNGGPGQLTSIFVQGSNSNQVLILVDGIAINDSATGIASIQNIHPDMIEKIEIVKSPRASLYGSNAVGGVIHVFTKRNQEGVNIGFKSGSDNTKVTNIFASREVLNGRMGLQLNHYDTAGFPSKEGSNINSAHDNRSVKGFFDQQWGSSTLKASVWNSQGTTDYLDFFFNPISQDFDNTAVSLNFDQKKNETWSSSLHLGINKDFLDQNDSNDFNHSKKFILEWKNNLKWNPNNQLLAGITFENEEFEASNYGLGIDSDMSNRAVFLENIFLSGKNQFLIALRLNNKENIEDKISWNLEYGYRLNSKTRLLFSAGKAHRNPSSFDLYGFGGNPLLRPEYSKKISVGLNYQPNSSTNFDLRYFDNRIKDLVAFNYSDFKLYNIEESKTSGFDVIFEKDINNWILSLNATLQDPKNLTTSTQLLRRPKNSMNMGLRRTFNKLTINLNLEKNSSRNDFGGVVLGAYTLANASIQYRLNTNWIFNGSITNLGNEKYTLANGYMTPDRKINIGFVYFPNG